MYDIIIIGAGPAGLTAAIYAGRAGLNALVIDKAQSGGTVNVAPLIENYPGVDKITGIELMNLITEQARQYAEIKEHTMVLDIHDNGDSTFSVDTGEEVLKTKFVILATGTQYRKLTIDDSDEDSDNYIGRGLSYCAVCDGTFFIGWEVIIVGGGNSAATEALYLNRVGVKCSIVHRRDSLRCDGKLKEDIKEAGIKVYWNCEVKRINGENSIESVTLYNNKTHEETTIDVNGIFVAIGYVPHNELAKQCGVKCNEQGYVIVDEHMKTNIDGIFAVGDITGGIKQIIVSEAQGAIAVSTIDKDIIT